MRDAADCDSLGQSLWSASRLQRGLVLRSVDAVARPEIAMTLRPEISCDMRAADSSHSGVDRLRRVGHYNGMGCPQSKVGYHSVGVPW